jgi:hypothetical protein
VVAVEREAKDGLALLPIQCVRFHGRVIEPEGHQVTDARIDPLLAEAVVPHHHDILDVVRRRRRSC